MDLNEYSCRSNLLWAPFDDNVQLTDHWWMTMFFFTICFCISENMTNILLQTSIPLIWSKVLISCFQSWLCFINFLSLFVKINVLLEVIRIMITWNCSLFFFFCVCSDCFGGWKGDMERRCLPLSLSTFQLYRRLIRDMFWSTLVSMHIWLQVQMS